LCPVEAFNESFQSIKVLFDKVEYKNMPLMLNSNTTTLAASQYLSMADLAVKKSLSKLSSGKQIVSSSENAGGFAVSSKIKSSLQRNQRLRENLNNSISFLQVQGGALTIAGKLLSRMSELKTLSLLVIWKIQIRNFWNFNMN
jgi:hypothetical protein